MEWSLPVAAQKAGYGWKLKRAFIIARSWFLPNRNVEWWAAVCSQGARSAFSQISKQSFRNRSDMRVKSCQTRRGSSDTQSCSCCSMTFTRAVNHSGIELRVNAKSGATAAGRFKYQRGDRRKH